jgi:hypothetical protein
LKNLWVLLFRAKVLILLKEKRFFKFLIIGEPLQTAANGVGGLRTAAKARERLFTVRFLRFRIARIVEEKIQMLSS